jgi:hypothetical protein
MGVISKVKIQKDAGEHLQLAKSKCVHREVESEGAGE